MHDQYDTAKKLSNGTMSKSKNLLGEDRTEISANHIRQANILNLNTLNMGINWDLSSNLI